MAIPSTEILNPSPNCLRIRHVVLVRLHVRLHKLRRHQTNRVPEPFQHASPVMRTGAGLHADQARWEVHETTAHLVPFQLLRSTSLPRTSTAWTWKTFFAKSIPTVVIFTADAPILVKWLL